MPPDNRTHKVTLDDVAQAAGVSPATVSLVLRNKPGVGEATRRRVLDEAERLGYHLPARKPSSPRHGRAGRVKSVGVIVKARADDPPQTNEFYSRVLVGIEAACRSHQLNLLWGTVLVDMQNRPLEVPALLEEGGADGLLVVGMQLQGALLSLILRRHPAIVLVDSYAARTSGAGFDAVLSNNSAGGETAAQELIAAGHRHLAVLGAAADAYPSLRERYHGFVDTVAAHRDCHLYRTGAAATPDEAAALFGALLAQNPEISGCFGGNDLYAIAAMRAAQAAGRRVPDDLSIVGFDGIDLGEHTSPPLTTLSVDKLKMGRVAVDLLLDRVAFADAAPTIATITPRLLLRGSLAQRE